MAKVFSRGKWVEQVPTEKRAVCDDFSPFDDLPSLTNFGPLNPPYETIGGQLRLRAGVKFAVAVRYLARRHEWFALSQLLPAGQVLNQVIDALSWNPRSSIHADKCAELFLKVEAAVLAAYGEVA